MVTEMDLGRRYRTIRHLTTSQLVYRLVCRGKFTAMEHLPRAMETFFAQVARLGPMPNPSSPGLERIAPHVLRLQRAVHGPFMNGVPDGRFVLLNREIDFGGLAHVEWRRDLGEKNNRLWRLNLSYMGYLVPLFEADPCGALPIVATLLRSLKEQNPWSSRGVFRDVWHPYAASHRVINLLTCLRLAHVAGIAPTSDVIGDIVSEIRLCAAFVRHNLERDLGFNHLLKNFAALAVMASACPGAGFASRTLTGVRACVADQFLLDGGQAERSPMYQLLTLNDLRILRDSDVLTSADTSFVSDIAGKAEAAANAMIHSDGDVALFNDAWLGEAPPAEELISPLNNRPHTPQVIELPQTGYVRLAQAGDTVVMDFGACGPDKAAGHAHADFLSLELSVGGERVIVDMGVPTYSEGTLRDRCRSSAAHNGPAFEGAESIEFWNSFRVGRRGYAYKLPVQFGAGTLAFAGWQSGYLHLGAFAARALWLFPGRGLLIVDLWVGSPELVASSSFLIGEKWAADAGSRFVLTSTSKAQINFAALEGSVKGLHRASYWQRFGVEIAGTRMTIVPDWVSDFRISGLWMSWSDQQSCPPCPRDEWIRLRRGLVHAVQALPEFRRCI